MENVVTRDELQTERRVTALEASNRIREKYFFLVASIFGAAMIAIVVLMVDIRDDVAILKSDFSVLKTDVTALKTDVTALKTDVTALKTDVTALKTDVAFLKENAVLKTDTEFIKQQVYEVLDETGVLDLAANQ